MEVKVRFRFNKITGEVEVFDVDQEKAPGVTEAEHNREHDRVAAEIGRVIERNPLVQEVFSGQGQVPGKEQEETPDDVEQEKERKKQKMNP
jgi:hypothetical protein